MKKFVKLIPVALGLLTLASCSNDDFFGDSSPANKLEQYGEGWLIVHEENLAGENDNHFTRSYRSSDMSERLWVNTDEMRVYDNDLHKYDIFSYQNGDQGEYAAFRLKTSRTDADNKAVMNIKEAKYALYPKEDVISGHWDYNEVSGQTRTTAQVVIPAEMVYDGTNKAIYKDGQIDSYVPVFKDVLPQWGSVETTDQGYLETHLSYLTGILRLKLNGTPKYAKALKVMMYDKNGMVPLNMNGQYTVCLATNDVPDVPQTKEDGSFIAGTGAEIDTKGAAESCEDGSIVIDMTQASRDFDDINKDYQSRSTLWVPLVCTPGRSVDIVVYAAEDEGVDACSEDGWKEIMRFEDKTIVRGKYYGNPAEYNLAVGGYDPNAINDALETAEPDEDGVIRLETENEIGVCNEGGANTILIPNKENTNLIVIDLTEGLKGCESDQTLYIKYKDNNDKFEGDVLLITPADGGPDEVNITTMIDKSGFGLAGNKYAKVAIDADEFMAGDGVNKTRMDGEDLTFSDNVKALTIEKNASIMYDQSEDYCTLAVPDAAAGLETINIYGGFFGSLDAHTADVDINVVGEGTPAQFIGGARTQGAITASGKSVLYTDEGFCTVGFSAFGDVTISDQSFVIGSVLSKEGDIIINNVDLNAVDYLTSGGKLSDLVYETFDLSEFSSSGLSVDNITYGPLYAEEGSVKVTATNSTLVVNDQVAPEAIQAYLNEKAALAVKFTVYAAKDIEFSGEETTINGKMWAENDVRLSGKTTAKDGIRVDNDFSIIEQSKAKTVKVGHNATVNVDEQDGNCVAITKQLIFVENELGNALALEQGYIAKIDNGTAEKPVEVQLAFSTSPAYAAIGTATVPMSIIPQNESKWNGKQMPAALVETYIGSDPYIYTATELAYQTVAPTTSQIFLLSDINLMNEKWNGINAMRESQSTVNMLWTNKTVSNVNLRGHGFFNYIENGGVYGLKLNNVISTAQVYDRIVNIIKDEEEIEDLPEMMLQFSGGVGALAGYAEDAAISNVTVVLKGTLGSDGEYNKETVAVGGLIGFAEGNITMRGVRVNAKAGALGGYAWIGGLIGYADGNIVIADAGQLDIDLPTGDNLVLPAATTKVGGLKVNVTYNTANPPYIVNDIYQGATGTFIGAADVADEVNSYTITATKGNTAFEEDDFTVTGAQENLAFINAGDSQAYKFERSAAQNMIGNCGFVNSASQIKIGSDFYEVKKGLDVNSATPGYKPLYFLKVVGLVPGN